VIPSSIFGVIRNPKSKSELKAEKKIINTYLGIDPRKRKHAKNSKK